MRLFVAGLLVLISGCSSIEWCESQVYVGLTYHPEKLDAPEHYAPNPLGKLGAECRHDLITIYAEHTSSIPYYEKGLGLNEAGFKIPLIK